MDAKAVIYSSKAYIRNPEGAPPARRKIVELSKSVLEIAFPKVYLLMQFSAPSSPGPRGEMSMSSDV
jgi:hypothetical protein